jgi:hypothetical protein
METLVAAYVIAALAIAGYGGWMAVTSRRLQRQRADLEARNHPQTVRPPSSCKAA